MINQEIINIQEKLFQVKRKFPEHRINLEKGDIADLKLFFHCDTIFKAQGLIWFVNEIKTIEYEELR
tara:strand:- start:642 stop:842 length:201 start_codon:yes stop_codon:yes gene_type:complete